MGFPGDRLVHGTGCLRLISTSSGRTTLPCHSQALGLFADNMPFVDYKYQRACYYDKAGNIHWIVPDDLKNPHDLALARSVRLYDETEEYRLFPRARESGPHFFCRSREQRRLVVSAEADPRHNKRRDELKDSLLTVPGLKLGYREYFGPEKFDFVEVAEIEGYTWETEVTRIVPYGLRVRHDIFGASPVLAMSERRPWIAIEVISTHYLDEGTFDSLMALSADLPLLVLFDLVEAPNYFISLDTEENTLRFIYCIYNGKVWRNEKETKLDTAAKLKAVLQTELRDLRRRNDGKAA